MNSDAVVVLVLDCVCRTLFSLNGCAVQVPHESEVFNILGIHNSQGGLVYPRATLELFMIPFFACVTVGAFLYKTGFVTALAELTGLQYSSFSPPTHVGGLKPFVVHPAGQIAFTPESPLACGVPRTFHVM